MRASAVRMKGISEGQATGVGNGSPGDVSATIDEGNSKKMTLFLPKTMFYS